MTLHPQARAAVEETAGQPPVRTPGYDIADHRRRARETAAAEPREAVDRVVDLDLDGVPARLYAQAGPAAGLVVHLHGGGFVFNDIDVHDAAARRLALRSGLAVLSVEYRRPPEHRFPAAPDDIDTALAWLVDHGAGLGLDVPLAVHGDSAGANLALVAALRHPGRFAAVVLIYPFLDPAASFDSYAEGGIGFDPRDAAWYWQQYARTEADLIDPDLAPLRSVRLGSLPPTLVVTAEHDPLCGEGEHLAARLAEEGVEVAATRYLGQIHGFWRHPAVFDAAEPLTRQAAGFLRQHLSRAG